MKKQHIIFHKDGSVCAKENMVDGALDGYWVWFKKDGIKIPSGCFKKEKQIDEWTAYK